MTRSTNLSFAVLAGAFLLTSGLACKKPETIQAPVTKQGPSEEELRAKAEAEKRAAEEARKHHEAEAAAKRVEEAKRAEMDKKATYQRAAATALQDIHFDYDKSEIRAEDKDRLTKLADFMRVYPIAKVEIQGHCDERGTNEYNIALGNHRASSTMRYLAALGIQEERFTLLSFGKEKPLCNEGHEGCWSRNRRSHFELK